MSRSDCRRRARLGIPKSKPRPSLPPQAPQLRPREQEEFTRRAEQLAAEGRSRNLARAGTISNSGVMWADCLGNSDSMATFQMS